MPHRGGGAAILVVISTIMLVFGMIRLAKSQRWLAIALWLAFLIGYPVLFYISLQTITDRHLKMWIGILMVMPAPIWLMAGTMIYGIAERPSAQWFAEGARKPSTRTRLFGAAVFAAGIAAWCFGAFNPDLSEKASLTTLAVSLYGLLFGSFWLIGGRSLND